MIEVKNSPNYVYRLPESVRKPFTGNYATGLPSRPVAKSPVDLSIQPDTFTKTSDKEPLNKKKAITFGSIISGGIIGSAVSLAILTRGRVKYKGIGPVKYKELAEHIDFKKAKTLWEAKRFGKKHLQIKTYEGFTKKDLDVINWINESLVNVSNFKKGKLNIPDIIRYAEMDPERLVAAVHYNKRAGAYANILSVNKKFVKILDRRITEKLATSKEMIGRYSDESIKGIRQSVEKFENNQLTDLQDKFQLSKDLSNLKDYYSSFTYAQEVLGNPELRKGLIEKGILVDGKIKVAEDSLVDLDTVRDTGIYEDVYKVLSQHTGYKPDFKRTNPGYAIYHETGHLQFKTVSEGTGEVDFFERLEKYWDNDMELFKTALSVSDYASTSPGEFVAEAFSEMVSEHKLSDKAVKLFEDLTK